MACIFIGITTKSLYGKNYIGIYEKMNKKPETVVTYYESKGFLLVSSKCSFEGNYQTGEVDSRLKLWQKLCETECSTSYASCASRAIRPFLFYRKILRRETVRRFFAELRVGKFKVILS